MLLYKLCYPFNTQEDTGVPFQFYFKKGSFKINVLWPSRLWVGRRKEHILGYVPKSDEKKNLVHKGLKKLKFLNCINLLTPRRTLVPLSLKFQCHFKKGSSKKNLWAFRLWVGRRKEPILGYVPKNDKKIHKGLMNSLTTFLTILYVVILIKS